MSSLGELFFTLGLDDKKFDDAIEAAKKKIKDLGADVEIGVKLDLEGIKKEIQNAVKAASGGNLEVGAKVKVDGLENLRSMLEASKKEAKDLENAIANASAASVKVQKQSELDSVRKRIANQEAQIKSKEVSSGNTTSTPLKVTIDQDSVNIVQAQLAKLGEPITAKISVEYDLEKFQAVETAMKNFGSRINQAMNAGLPQSSTPYPSKTGKQKGMAGWLDKVSETLFGDSADGGGYSTPAASAANISQVSSALGTLSKEIEALGKATEKISKRASSKKSVVSDEEAEMRRYYSQLQRLEEGVRRWQNVKAKIESSKIDKTSDNYRQAIRLIDDYIAKLVEAQAQAGKFSNRELAGMLGQTASGEIAKTGRLVAQQKSDEQAIRNNLAREQAQIQRLEEGVRRVQNVIAKLNATDVDKGGAGYKQAIALLNDYIDKLNTAKKNAGNFTKREMTGMLGQTLGGEIAEAERLVAAQKKVEQSKKKTAKSVTQAEKDELQLKREKIKLQKEEANLGKARANQKKAELQKEKEAVRLKKERVSLQKKLGKSVGNMANWAKQLNQQLGNYISIYSIERFVRNLYTIGGEFQKQQIALQNMLGDVDKGNAIFERMKGLAVKSPFTFSELASYTKQMSAYGVEYENLYDTTKRLADISAGVGVDMGRLILAFGQVRSAAVLRGQELRQFTEAGIPLVDELAKKFSELERRTVSAGEVFDKISKREVSFGMVKDILFDMTDPGGKFFQTQEQLAESLAGKWSNLKDAWDIMMADIANGNNTTLKNLAEWITGAIKNWETFVPLIEGAVLALGSFRSLATIFGKSSPWMMFGSVMLGGATVIRGYMQDVEDATELTQRLSMEAEKVIGESRDNESTANRYLDILKRQGRTEEEKANLLKKQQKTFEELLKLYPEAVEVEKLELLTLEEIEATRKRIAKQTEDATILSLDNQINEAYNTYENEKKKAETIAREAGLPLENFPETVKRLDALYALYEKLLDKKFQFEESRKPKIPAELFGWQKIAKELVDKYANEKIYFKDPTQESDIYAYFDHLADVFKDAKDKYDKTISESLRKPQKDTMNAANAINLAIGGRTLYHKENDKKAKDQAKYDADAYLNGLKERLKEIGLKWSLFKELMEVTGNRSLSMNLSGLVGLNFESQLEHLKDEMAKELKNAGLGLNAGDVLGMDFDEVAKAVNDKDKLKPIKEIYDTFHQANRTLRTETVKDFAAIIKASRDFEAQITEVERKLQEDLKKLRKGAEEGGMDMDSNEYKRAEKKLRDDAETEKANIRFEEFKKSSDWVKVFDDLDRVSTSTLDNMITKVEEFAKQAYLSEEVTKQLVEAMSKLRDETIERNPFKGFEDAWKRLGSLKLIKKNGVLVADGTQYRTGSGTENDPYKFTSKKDVDDGIAEANDDLEKSALAVSDKFEAVAKASDMLSTLFESMGADMSGFFGAISDIFGNTASGAQTGAGIASAFGATGPWGAIAGAVIGVTSALFSQVDKSIQREVESSERREKEIGNIAKSLEKALERNMGGMFTMKLDSETSEAFSKVVENYNNAQQAIKDWNSGGQDFETWRQIREFSHLQKDTIEAIKEALGEGSYYDAQLAALKIQRDEVQKQMKLEDEKKKTDKDKMLDYEQQIRELNDSIENFAEDMANTLYGIDFKDWADQLAESMVDAWANGEDAAEAYRDTVNDILKNLGVSIISQKILQPMLEKTMNEFLSQFSKDNGVLTDNSMEILSGMLKESEYAANATKAYLEGLKNLGVDLSNISEDVENGLSKSIQGVTEDTADLLASYINSIRADVSANRTLFEQLVNVSVPRISMLAEAQLQQLQMVVSNTKRNADAADKIYDLVNRVVDKGSNKLKV